MPSQTQKKKNVKICFYEEEKLKELYVIRDRDGSISCFVQERDTVKHWSTQLGVLSIETKNKKKEPTEDVVLTQLCFFS